MELLSVFSLFSGSNSPDKIILSLSIWLNRLWWHWNVKQDVQELTWFGLTPATSLIVKCYSPHFFVCYVIMDGSQITKLLFFEKVQGLEEISLTENFFLERNSEFLTVLFNCHNWHQLWSFPPYIRCWNNKTTCFCRDFIRKAETKHEAEFPSSFRHTSWCGISFFNEQDPGWRAVLSQCPCPLPAHVGLVCFFKPARTGGPSSKERTGTWARQWVLSSALLILMGMAAWWHPWVLSCSATDGAGGGRHERTMRLSLQRPCKTTSLFHARGKAVA